MFSPDGQLGDIPYERMHDAVQAGATPAVKMKAPDGSIGYVPAPKTQDAVKAGASIVPLGADDLGFHKPGVWDTVKSDFASLFSSQPKAIPDLNEVAKTQNVEEKAAGHSLPYRVGAAAATALGANVPGMEQAAKEGNPSAVVGHAVAGAAPYAVGAGIGAASDFAAPYIEGGAKSLAQEMYQSALKPSTRLNPTKVAAAIDTGLGNKIPISPNGLNKLNGLIDDLNNKISAAIPANSPATINKFDVTSRLGDVAKKFSNQVNPEADLSAVSDAGNEFLRNQPAAIPAADAQALKQGTYQQLGSKAYGEMKTATIEAQKALARGIKEEIVTQFPELKNLNAQESKFLNLEPLLEKAVQRIGNHQLLGIGTPIAGGAAAAVTGSKQAGLVAGIVKAVVDNPAVKSRLAIALNQTGVDLPTALARVGSYSVGLGQGLKNEFDGPDATQGNR